MFQQLVVNSRKNKLVKKHKKTKPNPQHTDCKEANSSSSAIENRAFDSMLATVSGCKLRIADTASLDIVGSYNKAYHLCAISLSVNLQLNLTPLWTIDKLFVCKKPSKIDNEKLSVKYKLLHKHAHCT